MAGTNIYGELVRAQLQNSASDLANPVSGLAFLETTNFIVKWYANGGWKTAFDTTTAQTATNKTFTAPLITTGGSVDVTGAGSMSLFASMGANTLTIGGAATTVLIPGALTVQGALTSLTGASLEVADKNIEMNKGGNDAASEGAGLTVDRTGTSGSFIYAAASATRWKLGDLGAEVDVMDISTAQTVSSKTFGNSNIFTVREDRFEIQSTAATDRKIVFDVQHSGTATTTFLTATGSTSRNYTLPDASTTFLGHDTSQVVTNKDIDGGTASNTSRLTLPKASKATLDGLTRKEGTLWYASDLDKVYKDDGSTLTEVGSGGSGSGEINIITNPSAVDDTTGWTAAANYTVARDTSNSPLAPLTSTCFSMLTSTASAESSTSGIYYTISTQPTGLRNKKLKIEFYCTVPATADGVWRLSVYGGGTRLALSTDSSSVTTLPGGFTGKFTAYFDADSSSSYTVNFTQTTRTNANTLYVTNVIDGPGIQPQGAIVGPWVSFTPTGTWVANTTYTGRYRRVGDEMEVETYILNSGAPTAAQLLVNLPSGFTIHTQSLPASGTTGDVYLGAGTVLDSGTANYDLSVKYQSTTSVSVRPKVTSGAFATDDVVTDTVPITFGNNDSVYISYRVPISEWVGAGTLNLAQNDVEYAYNSSTATAASDSTSFAWGPQGAQVQNITASIERRIRFQTPILATDEIAIEVSEDRVQWHSLASGPVKNTAGGANVQEWTYQNGTAYGIGHPQKVNATDLDIEFAQYAFPTGAFGAAGDAWSAGGGSYYWRVKKKASGQAVGFGTASTTAAGLVKIPNSYVRVHTGNGHGSSGTKIRRFTTTAASAGSDITYTQDATNGDYFTINVAGVYTIHYMDTSAGNENFGISLNGGAVTTTNIDGLVATVRLAAATTSGAGFRTQCSATAILAAGDTIRAHTGGNVTGANAANCMFDITQVYKF